jgi:hypothetical protein
VNKNDLKVNDRHDKIEQSFREMRAVHDHHQGRLQEQTTQIETFKRSLEELYEDMEKISSLKLESAIFKQNAEKTEMEFKKIKDLG